MGWLKKSAVRSVIFSGDAGFKVFVNSLDITADSRFDDIKASTDPIEGKIEKAKELAKDLARDAVSNAFNEAELKYGVKVWYEAIEFQEDNIYWAELFEEEEE